MERVPFDQIQASLRSAVDQAAAHSRFPLDVALTCAHGQSAERAVLCHGAVQSKNAAQQEELRNLLTLLDVTSTSAGLAIKRIGKQGDDTSGIRDALVDLWGRAEAARCLWFDTQHLFSGEEVADRIDDLWETSRLLAPEAIAIAMRLSEPVVQYVEFASKFVKEAPRVGA